MNPATLQKKSFEGVAQFIVALGAFLFLPAWSLRYWQGWIFWLEFSLLITLITVYFLKKDPALIERRLKAGPGAETERSQKLIQILTSFFFVALIIFPAIDHRFGWSHLPVIAVLAGDAIVAVGLAIIFFVFKENSYTSGIIEVGAGQPVISTGPYRFIRHPMYAGALLMMLGIPLALGSRWGLLLWVPLTATIVWRLVDEETYLSQNLTGYVEYRAKTRYRLVPGIY